MSLPTPLFSTRLFSTPRAITVALATSTLLLAGGCSQMAAQQLENDHAAFNTAVADAMDRQMLLNLVRLAHDEPTQWVSVTQINTSTTYRADVSSDASFQGIAFEGARAGAGFSYTPTLTFVPRQGEQLANEMMAPIPIQSIENLVSAGYPLAWILFLGCERIQGVQSFDVNVRDSVSTLDREFARTIALLGDLQRRGLISLSLVQKPITWNWTPISKESVTLAAVMSARADGSVLTPRTDGAGYDFVSVERVPVFTLYDGAEKDPAALELCEILDIRAGAGDWKLVGLEGAVQGDFMTARTRSLMAVLRLLSLGVDRADIDSPRPARAKTATEAFASLGEDEKFSADELRAVLRSVFVVERSKSAPANAAVSVLHDGSWYWIREDDRMTKQTFALIRDLFDLQVKPLTSMRPVLTIPVR